MNSRANSKLTAMVMLYVVTTLILLGVIYAITKDNSTPYGAYSVCIPGDEYHRLITYGVDEHDPSGISMYYRGE